MEHANRVVIPMRLIVALLPTNVTPGPTNVTFCLNNASPQPDQRHAVSPRKS